MVQNNNRQCPHFMMSKTAYCKVSVGGLFIPMPGHVELFCRSANFDTCYHFLKCEETLKQANEISNPSTMESRRRHLRFQQQWNLALAHCDQNGRPTSIIDPSAQTADISLGGFRVTTKQDLSQNKQIVFIFGTDFTSPSFSGLGEIRWTTKEESASGFTAGLSFLDQSSKQVVGNHLGVTVM